MRPKLTATSAALLLAVCALPAHAQPKEWGKREKPKVTEDVARVDLISCPLCATPVERVITVAATEYELDTDYKVVKASFNVYPYVLTACPKCSYGTYSANFHKELSVAEKKVLEEELEAVRAEYKDAWEMPLSHVIRVCSATHRALKSGTGTLYEIYLLGSYLAREANDPSAEREMQRRAVECLVVAIEKDEAFATAKNRYMAGEIHRRLGNYKDALEWYGKAKVGATEVLAKIIARQESQTREAMKPKNPKK